MTRRKVFVMCVGILIIGLLVALIAMTSVILGKVARLLHNLLLVDVVGPPSAEVCRIVANFPQVDDLRFINQWEA